LVRFGWEGGCSDLAERGYHVEAVYDIFEDFMSRMEGESGPDYNPTKSFPDLHWSARRAPDALHPAHLAREVLREYFATGEVLAPPHSLDRHDYDSSGGAWVSIRSREDIYERHARSGFWHFPGEQSWGPGGDIVRAAICTAHELRKDENPPKLLDESYIAVTFFSALRRTTVGELDNDRYGIVVVSAERPEIMGGALPRMPGIRDEWQQFRHARTNNAQLYAYEPYVIYRHGVSKYVEPGAPWQPGGAPASEESPDLGLLAVRARDIVLGQESGEPLAPLSLPQNATQLFVTIYMDGDVCGCMGSVIGDLEKDLCTLTKAALEDDRFDHPELDSETTVAVSISVLSNELEMGDFSREEVQVKYRHGQQALMVEQNARSGSLLPFVTSWLSLDAEDFVDEVLDKAGVTRPPYNWIRFDCDTWLADDEGVSKLVGGFKHLPPTLPVENIARLHAEYLLRNQREDGDVYFGYYPFQNTLYQGIDTARLAYGAWILARIGKREAAASTLKYVLAQERDETIGLAQDAFVLLALCEPGVFDVVPRAKLWEALLASIDRHGQVVIPAQCTSASDDPDEEDTSENVSYEDLQNYVPGQVLLALATHLHTGGTGDCIAARLVIERALRYYRHRFRYKRDFGQVLWLSLASAAWWQVTQQREWRELLFEITDWILTFQQLEASQSTCGGFLTDHQPDAPGFTTAVYLEAIAAALNVAASISDTARQRRYDQAWTIGFAFLDRLIIQDRDSSVLPNAEYAMGGLRENLYSGHVRIDFVQHSLAAIISRHPAIFHSYYTDQENQSGT
jgi:AMMECR1 domain-containing protein